MGTCRWNTAGQLMKMVKKVGKVSDLDAVSLTKSAIKFTTYACVIFAGANSVSASGACDW